MIFLRDVRWMLNSWYEQRIVAAPVKLLLMPFAMLYDFLEKHTKLLPITIEKVNLVLTPRCTLRCKKCCNLMPYHKNPADFTYEDVLQDAKDLLKIVRKVKCLQLLGGEPLLFKNLPQLLDYLKNERKIKKILLVTNGTIIPSAELLSALKHRKVQVIISNYVKLNTKINEVFTLCRQYNINVRLEGLVWRDMDFSINKQRTCEENQRIFTECYRECHELFNGEYHLCSRSSNATFIGMVARNDGDYANIRHNNNREKRKKAKEELRKILLRTKYITACEHCMGNRPDNPIIVDAEQLPFNTYLDFNGNIVQK